MNRPQGKWLRFVYKRIVAGDIRKLSADSADSGTGGGARDFRFNPSDKFWPIFERMFTKVPNKKCLNASLIWSDGTTTTTEAAPPTPSRPNEARITRVNACCPEDRLPPGAEESVFILIQTEVGVHAFFMTRQNVLDIGFTRGLEDFLIRVLDYSENTKVPMGFVDLEDNTQYSSVGSKMSTINFQPYFKREDILAAIRTKPFILLAGISGTGKSRLVRQLARGCCPRYEAGGTTDHPLYNEKKPGNFEIIQVRPNWHDSTELMGYVTRIVKPGEPPKCVLTSFVEFLAKAWTYREIPFFLCLDEMNLAPVEQYFAEYLSVIENREKVKLDEGNAEAFEAITTDPLVRWGALEQATFDNVISDLFAGKKWADAAQHGRVEQVKRIFKADKGIRIPPNLIVMGTVNMDETTCTFSRKVLDRAMSFELNDVSDMYDVAKIGGEGNCPFGSIPASVAQGSLLTGKDACEADQEKCKQVLEILELLNERTVSVAGASGTEEKRLLAGTPFKIAYRSRNEILIYCIERTKDGAVSLPKALDEALSMKVLSRIEGDNQKVPTQWLELLRKAIDEKLKTLTGFAADECKTCMDKLRDMAEQSDLGYTSFWTR